jgi:hypothetical protein
MKQTIGNALPAVGLEEHYASPTFWEGPGRSMKEMYTKAASLIPSYANIVGNLTDLGEKRIAAMDAAGIEMQVLSLTAPGVQQLNETDAVNLTREANDYAANAVKRYPKRLAAFATLPTVAPDIAANELEKRVQADGFIGGIINGHSSGRYLDDKFFWPILERAEFLRVPLYIHPTIPPKPVIDAYYSGFLPQVTNNFSAAAWGWHIETAVHVLRLILGGVFDQFPNLQVIIGHLGEALPFMMPRLDDTMPVEGTKLNRSVGSYLRENLYYTFSGFTYIPPFLDLFLQVGSDRIIFSTDYPFSPMDKSRTFLDNLPVSIADKHRMAHSNAERLLKIEL